MAVLQLVPRCAEPATVSALREMLERAVRGRLTAISCSFRDCDVGEDHITTGLYHDQPAEAVRAALRASMLLTELEEPERGTP